jgi:hypothetical protein
MSSVFLSVCCAFQSVQQIIVNTPSQAASGPPTYVTSVNAYNSLSVNNVTSPSLTLSAGDVVAIFCRSPQTSGTFSFSSTPTNTINGSFGEDISGGSSQMALIQSAGAGSTTVNCQATNAGTYMALTVLQFHPGFLTAVDTSSFGHNSGTSITSSSFSTSAKGLIIFCADARFASGTFSAGLIGGVSSNLATSGGTFPPCEYLITTTAQISITAAMSVSTGTGTWGYAVLALK